MKSKRVGFVVRSMVIRSLTSGICNSIIEWIDFLRKNDCSVDIITDSADVHPYFIDLGINIHVNDNILTYTKHSDLFQFKDGFNFERCLNMRNSLVSALSKNMYDVLICNEPESAFVCYMMELYKHMKIVYYTHEPGTFFDAKNNNNNVHRQVYFDFIRHIYQFPLYVGFPSENSIVTTFGKDYPKNFRVLHSLPTHQMLDDDSIQWEDKEGILYSGRIEDRKNPGLFMKTLKAIEENYGVQLKIKFLTKETHVAKAHELCKKYEYTNYEIKCNLLNDEKFKYIESCRLSYYPAIQETFGLSAFESLRYHPTIFLSEYDWYTTFKDYDNFVLTSKADACDTIWINYNTKYKNNAVEFYRKKFNDLANKWVKFVQESNIYIKEEKNSIHNKYYKYLESNANSLFSLERLYSDLNPKQVLYLSSDIEPLYCMPNAKILHDDKNTYIGICNDNSFKIKSKKESNNFFEFE